MPSHGGSCAKSQSPAGSGPSISFRKQYHAVYGASSRGIGIGKPIFARSEFSFPAAQGHARKWISKSLRAGGGPIADVGVHCIDTLRYILQDEVARVSGRGLFDDNSGDMEAAAALTLEFSKALWHR